MTAIREVWCELRDQQTGAYVEGWGVIAERADVPHVRLAEAITQTYGSEWDRLVVEVQHLTFVPRIKWCSRRDGFGCDNEGEWHSHWFEVKHDDARPVCCHTLAVPVWAVAR